ncbi:MAG: hypothetical protein R3B45_04730 [Bdellovibrionota bacterium]
MGRAKWISSKVSFVVMYLQLGFSFLSCKPNNSASSYGSKIQGQKEKNEFQDFGIVADHQRQLLTLEFKFYANMSMDDRRMLLMLVNIANAFSKLPRNQVSTAKVEDVFLSQNVDKSNRGKLISLRYEFNEVLNNYPKLKQIIDGKDVQSIRTSPSVQGRISYCGIELMYFSAAAAAISQSIDFVLAMISRDEDLYNRMQSYKSELANIELKLKKYYISHYQKINKRIIGSNLTHYLHNYYSDAQVAEALFASVKS